MHLTVGVIAQNGLPYLQRCLESLPPIANSARTVGFLLVDSASSDGTLEAMLAFARQRTDTSVFSMRGRVNAAAARNVVIENAPAGALLLVDGDVRVRAEFVTAAMQEFEAGSCDAIYGQLPEILHDADHRPVGRNADRYRVPRRRYTALVHGMVMLGPTILRGRIRYDEEQRRCEDLEFGLRLAARFRILAIAVPMGTHLTIGYYSAARVKDFYRESYLRPLGRVLRKQISRPWRIWHLRRPLSGPLLGLLLQLLLVGSAALASPPWTMVILALIAADVARFAHQQRVNEYVPVRVVAPWQIASGVVWPERDRLSYVVAPCRTAIDARGHAITGRAAADGATIDQPERGSLRH